MLGEFEAAVTEIIKKVAPEVIIVETTGLAEPEALVFNIPEALPECRLDGVVSVIDADMLVRFPELGHTTRLQIEGADILLLNKIDLVDAKQNEPLEGKLRESMAPRQLFAPSVAGNRSRTFIRHRAEKKIAPPQHEHQPEFESFTFTSDETFSRDCFERFAGRFCPRAFFGRRASFASRMARSFSISSLGAGNWNRFKPRTQS